MRLVRLFICAAVIGSDAEGVDRKDVEVFVDSILDQQVKQAQTPGAVFVFVQNGSISFARAYGYADLEHQTPMTVDGTVLRVASVSKPFTAVAALQLVEKRKLRLDEGIEAYLSPMPEKRFPARSITLGDLLTQSSGLDDRYIMSGLSAPPGRLAPWSEYVRRGFFHPLVPPGELFRYSNQNFVVAGHLIEHASGLGFADYMRMQVLQPLGMAHSSFDETSLPAGATATGYHFQNGLLRPLPRIVSGCNPAGSLVATGADIGNFVIMQLQGGAYEGKQLLQPGTVGLMQQPQFRMHPHSAGVSYGFWERDVNGLQTWEHAGTGPGFLSLMVLIPEKRAAIFVSHNSDNFTVFRGLMGAFFDRFYPAPAVIVPRATTPAFDLTRFAGYYRATDNPSSTIDKLALLIGGHAEVPVRLGDDGTLYLSMGPLQARLEPEEGLLFRDMRTGRRFAFRQNSNGTITHLIWPYSPLEKLRAYDRYVFQGSIVAGAVMILFSFLVIWPVAALRRSQHSGGAVWNNTLTIASIISLLELLFLAIAVAGVFHIVHLDFIEAGSGPPVWLAALLALPVFSAILSAVLVVECCRNRDTWSRGARVHAFLVVLATAGLSWVYDYWNALGWKY